MYDSAYRQAVRLRHKPDLVRVLFVGAAPSAGERFFYHADSPLFLHTQLAFKRALGPAVPQNADFLPFFQRLGCFMDNLCREPVAHLPKAQQQQAWAAAVDDLAARLVALQPQAVVPVMRAIEPFVLRAVEMADRPIVLCRAAPFPIHGNQQRYVSTVADHLLFLVEIKVLSPAS